MVAVGTAVLAVVLAIFGHDWIHRVFRLLLLLNFPLVTIITVAVLLGQVGSIASRAHYGFSITGFMAEFSAAAAYNITYAPYVSDYSRYLPSRTRSRSVIASVFFGASASAIWLIILGAWLAIHLNASNGLLGLKEAGNHVLQGLGTLTALASALALFATMGMNAYGGSLTRLTAVDSFKRIEPTRRARIVAILVLGVVWYLIGVTISERC